MLEPLALAALAFQGEPTTPPEKHSPLDVEIPRVEAPSIRIDAHLDEPEGEMHYFPGCGPDKPSTEATQRNLFPEGA